MIVVLLLLLIVVFIATSYGRSSSLSTTTANHSPPILTQLHEIGVAILEQAQVQPRPEFTLTATARFTRTERYHDIYIVITRHDGTIYDRNTLVAILCHELAHIITQTGDEHTLDFQQWESDLLQAAQEIGKYDDNATLDPTYPCY